MKQPAILFCLAMVAASVVTAEDKPNVKIKGDLRYRHEMIEKEGTRSRVRHRLRARVNIAGTVNDKATIVVGLSSGSDDPVSNNQSLTGGWSSKDVVLDVAYFEYKIKKAPGLGVLGGKIYNPFYTPGKSELIWDSDIRHEGLVAAYARDWQKLAMDLVGTGLWIEERAEDKNSYLLAGQSVFRYRLPGGKSDFAVGGSYYHYKHARGFAPFFDGADGFGNSLNPDTTYAAGFELFELLGELNFSAGRTPVTLLGNYVTNPAADSLSDGWLAGIRVGKMNKAGSWDFRYVYRELKKDAVVGMYTDSDFIGGGTNGKGHEIGVSFQAAAHTTLAATYFVNRLGIDNGIDYNRLQVDASFKF